jgi:hypothetical protein
MHDAAFYCVANSRHFLGAVALLNSLRLVGHDEPFYVLDYGLSAEERRLLDPHATIVPAPEASSPRLVKWAAPLAHPAPIMVLVDADVIVTRPLSAVLESAAAGAFVAFENDVTHRFHADWGTLLDLGEVKRRTYVNSGLLAFPESPGGELLQVVRDSQARVDIERSLLGRGTPADPFYYPDMDVWNAVLGARLRQDEIHIMAYRLAPHAPFQGLQLLDAATLRCAYDDGLEPVALHHVLRKPWLAATRANPYSRLLPRLLLAPDVHLRLDPGALPLRLRPGGLARVDRVRAELTARLASQRGRLGLRRRLSAWKAA